MNKQIFVVLLLATLVISLPVHAQPTKAKPLQPFKSISKSKDIAIAKSAFGLKVAREKLTSILSKLKDRLSRLNIKVRLPAKNINVQKTFRR